MGKTLLDKIWDAHTVRTEDGGRCVLYIDRQYIHEVTSPVAFAGLERRGIGVARPAQITATADHNIPTVNQHLPIAEPESGKNDGPLPEERPVSVNTLMVVGIYFLRWMLSETVSTVQGPPYVTLAAVEALIFRRPEHQTSALA